MREKITKNPAATITAGISSIIAIKNNKNGIIGFGFSETIFFLWNLIMYDEKLIG